MASVIQAKMVDIGQMPDVLVLLLNLDNLSLAGSIIIGSKTSLGGSGTALRARFGKRLRLQGLYGDDKDFVNMLLEV